MSDEAPVALAAAKPGDKVIKQSRSGTLQEPVFDYWLATVAGATPRFLACGPTRFARGTGLSRTTPKVRLVDPTPENVAALRQCQAERRAAADRLRAAKARQDSDQEREADRAAGWLALASDRRVVRDALSRQVLVDVYDELVRAGRLQLREDRRDQEAEVRVPG